MSEWVTVNNTKIEKHFLEQNIAEAKNYEWELINWSTEFGNHSHCIICGITIPEKSNMRDSRYYRSKGGWLCEYCFQNFLKV